MTISALLQDLHTGRLDQQLTQLGCLSPSELPAARQRAAAVISGYQATFQKDASASATLFSAPGRTEICGNHTDHQQGRVLAAAVNLDFLACAAPNGSSVIRFQSQGWPITEVDISSLDPREEEQETTAALIRGVAAQAAAKGFPVSGFDAFAVSNVLPGSGLSSSAACEILLGVIVNHLFCEDRLNAVTIAQMGQQAENVYFGKPSGLMDQMASSVGGAVAIDFGDPADPQIHPVQVDLAAQGYALCIIDSGADHADLTAEYASIPQEMKAVAAFFGKDVLHQVAEQQVLENLPAIREAAGDRAVLRALHFYADDKRVEQETAALEEGRFEDFLSLVRASGISSWTLLQNVAVTGAVKEQAVAVALAATEHLLSGRGACRVHGGGFAGTIQAFVPLDMLEAFQHGIEAALQPGCCHVLSIRPVGGAVLLPCVNAGSTLRV